MSYEITQSTATAGGSTVYAVTLLFTDPPGTVKPAAGAMTLQQLAELIGAQGLLGGVMTGRVAPAVITLEDGPSVALNAAAGNDFRWSLGGAGHTLATPANPVNGQMITLAIKYGGSWKPLFSKVFDFGSAGEPAWSATSGKTDYAGWRYDAALNGGAGSWAFQGLTPGLKS